MPEAFDPFWVPSCEKAPRDREAMATLIQKAKKLYKFRRSREAAFADATLFSDPAWDMLLGLYIDEGERRGTQVSAACIWSTAAPTTGLRYVERMVRLGIVNRTPDPFDARRYYISLSRASHDQITRLLSLD